LLYQIVVTDLHDPRKKYVAICNQWLAKDEEDGKISRDLFFIGDTPQTKKSKK
jgi:hypothetical protein